MNPGGRGAGADSIASSGGVVGGFDKASDQYQAQIKNREQHSSLFKRGSSFTLLLTEKHIAERHQNSS
jgi:hypothetical protein